MTAAIYYNSNQMLQVKVKRIKMEPVRKILHWIKLILRQQVKLQCKVFVWLAETYQPVSGVFEISEHHRINKSA